MKTNRVVSLGERLKQIAREAGSVDEFYEQAEAAIPAHLRPSVVPYLGEFYVDYGPHTVKKGYK